MRRFFLVSLIAGGSLVAAVTTVLGFGGALLGLWPSPHQLMGPLGALGGAIAGWLAHRPTSSLPFRAGALLAGAAAFLADFVTASPGVGSMQRVAAVVAVALALAGPVALKPLTRPVPPWLVAVGFVAVGFVFFRIVAGSGGLGHDEAAYALKARAWLEGTPDTGWSLHRGVGQSAIAAAVLQFSHSSEALRSVSTVLAMGTVVAVWALGRAIGSSRVGIAAATVFTVAPSFLRRGAEFLSDIPSTGLLLVVTILLWHWATKPEPTSRYLYAAVGVATAAVYVRYQSVLALALLGVGTALAAGPRLRPRLGDVLRAGGLGLALLVPHFVFATVRTGTPWGVITNTAEAGGREFLGQGLVDYVRDIPDLLAGQLGAVAIAVAIGWFVWCWLGHGQRRAAVFLAVPAAGQFLALGLISHGEPRFVFFPVALLTVAAAVAGDDLRRRLPAAIYRGGVAAFGVAAVASLGLHGVRFDSYAEARADSYAALVTAARIVNEESGERGCGIVTGMQPQMTWYSGCRTAPYDLSEVRVFLPDDLDRFFVLAEGGPRQPQGALREGYIALGEGDVELIEGSGSTGDVQVWRLAD